MKCDCCGADAYQEALPKGGGWWCKECRKPLKEMRETSQKLPREITKLTRAIAWPSEEEIDRAAKAEEDTCGDCDHMDYYTGIRHGFQVGVDWLRARMEGGK